MAAEEEPMARHIVCLTFDFDAMSGFVARGLTTPTPISRGEFGAVAAPRILDILALFGAPSTWFVPGVVIGTYPEVCARIVAAGCEIAHHGWTHRTPASLSREQEEAELVRGNEAIAKLSGRRARGYRSPAWDLSPHTVELLLKHGFAYDSSMMGHDWLPYFARQGDVIEAEAPMRFGPASALVELPISWSLDDFPHFEYLVDRTGVRPGLQNASGVLENWFGDFDYMAREADWGVLTYTMHPYVIGRGHRLLMLEKLIAGLAGRGAVFLTLEQAAAEFRHRAAG
jgi:peptidoglycan/xylan/chitin deacetylase (PgdA/CDA1 family)